MKPTLETIGSDNRFPITDCNYHAVALGGFNGRCAKVSSPSFMNISREYFKNEARYDFAGEAAFFVTIIITTAVALASGAYAVIQLCRAFGAL